MSKFNTLSIRCQIIMLVVVMTIVPLGIIVYTAIEQRHNNLQEAKFAIERLADEVANDQNVLISGAEQLLSTLPYIPSVQKRDAGEVTRLLQDLSKKNPQITNLLMIDNTGLVWSSALPMKGTITAADRRFFKNVMATGTFSSGEYTVGRVLSKPALSFGYPVRDRSGSIRDVATAAFSLDRYGELLQMKSLPEGTTLLLTDHKGTILFNAHAPQFIGTQDKPDLFRQMSQGPEEGIYEGTGKLGTKRIFAYRKIRLNSEQTPYLYIRAGIAKKSVFGKINATLFINVGVMLSSLFLAVCFTVYISRRGILDKITALRGATDKVSRGDLTVRVSDYVSGGEIGELGQSFDRMTQALIQTQEERKQTEQSLVKSEERYRLLSNLTSDYVHFCRRRGTDPFRIEWLGGAIDRITGYSQEELFAFGCWIKIVHPEDTKRVMERLMNLKPGDTDSDEFRLVRKDGQVRWVFEAYHCNAGDVPGELVMFGASQDVTRRKQQEQEIRILNGNLEQLVAIRTEELARINSELSSFCYAVSHELRAPIARLQGFSTALKEECPDKGELPFLAERIGSASRQLQKVVDSILMLSRLSRAELNLEEVNLSELAQKTVDKLSAEHPTRDVRYIVQPDMRVTADRSLLEVCMENLIGNAFKYSSQKPSARIEIGYEKKGNSTVYFVKDNGAGFDMDYADKLFTPFERLHQQDEFPGIGIGLATVQRIIDRHSGRLWAEGSVGEGAAFYFTVQ